MQVLMPAQREAMDVATEEMGELLQAFGKTGRFGPVATDLTGTGVTYDNLADVRAEAVDVVAAMVLLQYVGLLPEDDDALTEAVAAKAARIAQRLVTLDPDAFLKFVESKLGVRP